MAEFTKYFVWMLIPTFFILGMMFGWELAMCVRPKEKRRFNDGKGAKKA